MNTASCTTQLYTMGALMLIIWDPLLHNYDSHLCQKSHTDVDCHTPSWTTRAQIHPPTHEFNIQERIQAGAYSTLPCFLLYMRWITGAPALFPCSLGVVLRFDIIVPETKAHPSPLLIGHPGPNTPPLGCHFCFCASQSLNSVWQQSGRSRGRQNGTNRKEDPLQRSVKKEITK